jgi:CheY-like chemotaxis protein
LGYSHELWTTRLLAARARDRGPAAGHLSLAKLAQGTVCKILADHAVKPHKVRYYLEKRDPEFAQDGGNPVRLSPSRGVARVGTGRGDERSRRIPIVALTAIAMGWLECEALDSGCDAYISKPITKLGLLRTVESFLS